MKLVVGLGNPGKKYKDTRHNVGFLAIDKILETFGVETHDVRKYKAKVFYKQKEEVLFVKPQTFMNSSGDSVKIIFNQYKINQNNLYVVHDDLDIKLGEYKIQKGRGPKLHNGIESIEKSIGKKDFIRIRIGVDAREEDSRIDGEKYVLMKFGEDEKQVVDKTLDKVVGELGSILKI